MVEAQAQFVTVEELVRARLTAVFGGWRGGIESAVPTVVFVVWWTVSEQIWPAVLAAAVAAAVLAVVRAMQRQTVRFLVWAVVGVAIAAFVATRTGRAQDAFLTGMLQTAGSGLLFAVSNVVRWPVLGFVIAAGDPELAETSARLRASQSRSGRAERAALSAQDREALEAADEADVAAVNEAFTAWRRHTGIVTVASRLGWVLAGLAAVRLSVQVPLYLADQVTALGFSRIALGWPAYAVAILVMGTLLVRGHTPLDEGGQSSSSGGR